MTVSNGFLVEFGGPASASYVYDAEAFQKSSINFWVMELTPLQEGWTCGSCGWEYSQPWPYMADGWGCEYPGCPH
jgi:hypothetical protein